MTVPGCRGSCKGGGHECKTLEITRSSENNKKIWNYDSKVTHLPRRGWWECRVVPGRAVPCRDSAAQHPCTVYDPLVYLASVLGQVYWIHGRSTKTSGTGQVDRDDRKRVICV